MKKYNSLTHLWFAEETFNLPTGFLYFTWPNTNDAQKFLKPDKTSNPGFRTSCALAGLNRAQLTENIHSLS